MLAPRINSGTAEQEGFRTELLRVGEQGAGKHCRRHYAGGAPLDRTSNDRMVL